MKACIGPWVTSLYDTDRQASSAAWDSFKTVFETETKRQTVWENYNDDMLKYISDVLTNETAKTISGTF
jgi:E3 ubiquitin-protein ligase listerin